MENDLPFVFFQLVNYHILMSHMGSSLAFVFIFKWFEVFRVFAYKLYALFEAIISLVVWV